MENYEKIRPVGRGAYGTVYLCKRLRDKKFLIIKQIPVEQMTTDERQAALNEVKVLAMLDHPNIIEYYENFLEDKALSIVMEYAPGGTLFEYLQQRNGQLLEEEEILQFFTQMLLSLQHVHSKQILHRDLKTQNILLDKRKEAVKIGDFGISKVLSSKSKAQSVVGTPCYISPELCEGKPYNQKSDIWALGCVLYELASLKRAFEAQNLPALVLKIMRGTFDPIADHYSEELKQLILTMLHLDPMKRPDINQIMAMPIVLNALMNLYTDFGKIPCRRVARPISSIPGQGRPRVSMGNNTTSKGSAGNFVLFPKDSLPPQSISVSSVYCWGSGIHTPSILPLPSLDTQVEQVSTGRTQKGAVTKNGRLFIWEAPAVGSEMSMIPGALESHQPSFIPRYLEGQSGVTIKHIACGDLFTACLTDRGILMTFGSGGNGCLGHGNNNDVTQAKIVEKLLGFEVTEVACGASHVLAVTNEHEVFAWGRSDSGRLGLEDQESHSSPQEVPIPDQYKPSSVFCGVDCSAVLTLEGELLCSGSNRFNKLGLDDKTNQIEEVHCFTMMNPEPFGDSSISTVSMGTSHTAVITDIGECFTMGTNQFGQLGQDQSSTGDRMPRKIALADDIKLVKLSCGDTFSVAVSDNNEVFSWGKSARGRLGRQDDDSHLPCQVHIPHEVPFEVVSVSGSHGNTLIAIKPCNESEGQMD